jgi:hypothetical protein
VTIYKQEYVPSAAFGVATVQLADKAAIGEFKRGDKLMLRARAGHVLALDYESGVVKIAFLPDNATVYQATGWTPDNDDGPETEFVSYMSAGDVPQTVPPQPAVPATPTGEGRRHISDKTFTRLAPKLLRLVLRAGPAGWTVPTLASSLGTSSKTVVAVTKRMGAVLHVGWPPGRAGGPHSVTVLPGCEEAARGIDRVFTDDAQEARRAETQK